MWPRTTARTCFSGFVIAASSSGREDAGPVILAMKELKARRIGLEDADVVTRMSRSRLGSSSLRQGASGDLGVIFQADHCLTNCSTTERNSESGEEERRTFSLTLMNANPSFEVLTNRSSTGSLVSHQRDVSVPEWNSGAPSFSARIRTATQAATSSWQPIPEWAAGRRRRAGDRRTSVSSHIVNASKLFHRLR